jgi:hypothetical protein
MCLTGLLTGIWRFSSSARFRQRHARSHSPYAGWMRWHHYAGLLFGLFTFTWIISGAFSVNPFNMFSSGRGGLSRQQREIMTGGPLNLQPVTLVPLRAGIDAIRQHFAPKEVDVQQFRGKLYLTANRPPSTEEISGLADYRMVWLGHSEQGTFTKFDNAAIEEIAAQIMPGVPVEDKTWLHEYDNYYRSRDNSRQLPVLRIRYLDAQRTWLYLDPNRATMSQQVRSSRLNRWLYTGLHDFDFPYLYNRRPLWDIVVITLSIGGVILSSTTLWPMMKRLARHSRRFANALRRRESASRAARKRKSRYDPVEF